MRSVRRWLSGFALAALLLAVVAPQALAQGRRPPKAGGAEADRNAEDNLDDLLRRFGAENANLKEKIDQAIEKGAAWLISKQLADGHWECYEQTLFGYPMGGTALCALAIKKSIVGLYEEDEKELAKEVKALERKEKSGKIDYQESIRLKYLREQAPAEIEKRKTYLAAVDKALVWIKAKYKEIAAGGNTVLPDGSQGPGYRVYDLGVVLMLLEGYYTAKTKVKDGYALQVDQRKIPQSDLDWIREMVNHLSKVATTPNFSGKTFDGKGWRYPGAAQDGATVDNSNTQYAALGLKAGVRMGVKVPDPEKTWRAVAEYFMSTQDPDGKVVPRRPPAVNAASGEYFFPPQYTDPPGEDRARGWSYLPSRDAHHPTTGAMTTAALAGMIMAQSELHEAGVFSRDNAFKAKVEQSIADGMCWLGEYFSVERNPGAGNSNSYGWHYYYLYGLERAGVLCQTEFFGKNPWYVVGAKYLVGRQAADGSWDSKSMPAQQGTGPEGPKLADTAFAILFLKRATVPVNVPPVMKPVITGDK